MFVRENKKQFLFLLNECRVNVNLISSGGKHSAVLQKYLFSQQLVEPCCAAGDADI